MGISISSTANCANTRYLTSLDGRGRNYYQGTKVLTYVGSGYGWACERTPAEREKEKEFYGIDFDEYRSLKNGKETELDELPGYLEEKPSFDIQVDRHD